MIEADGPRSSGTDVPPIFSTEDTIVAVATPPGRGGIGVVRVSGPAALAVATALTTHAGPFTPRHATLTVVTIRLRDDRLRSRAMDQAIVTFFAAPHSYTGEDVVELSLHGSPIVLHSVVNAAVAAGARLAKAGEFTLRAFLNGRITLPQAEAVGDLIDAVTPRQAEIAFDQLQGTLTRAIADIDAELFDLVARLEASVDFPDEGFHFVEPSTVRDALSRIEARLTELIDRGTQGRLIREGHVVALVGAPNVGKSSLFNALVGSARAIVTPVPGTTRDLVSETIDLDGLRVTLVDTAGLRATVDPIESEGVERSLGAARVADLVVVVRDGTASDGPPAVEGARQRIDIDNKCDLPSFRGHADSLPVSAATRFGLGELRARIGRELGREYSVECPEISNSRHISLLERAATALRTAAEAVKPEAPLSEEFVLADLQDARACLEEISGRRTSDDLLAHIFERFCVGK